MAKTCRINARSHENLLDGVGELYTWGADGYGAAVFRISLQQYHLQSERDV